MTGLYLFRYGLDKKPYSRVLQAIQRQTLDSRVVKEVSRSAGFEVVRSIWVSRFFSGHRYVLLRRLNPAAETGRN